MISLNQLTIIYGKDYLFKDVKLNLQEQNRYAIVGANGSGKSTLLKIIAGDETPNRGSVDKPKQATVGLLKQDHFRYQDERIIDVMIDGKPQLAQAVHEKEQLLQKDDFNEQDCERLSELEETIQSLDGYHAEAQAGKILCGLGIPEPLHHQPLSVLSGGFKLRILLGQSLFQNPDVLLLDEPTNHLDIVSIAWLASYLIHSFEGLLMLVSHDRHFINQVATHILDVDYQTITSYPGTFEDFLAKKAEILAQKQHDLANKQQDIAEKQRFVDRFRASPTKAKQAQSRLKMIERIELPEIKASSRLKPYFAFVSARPSGKSVLEVDKLTMSFAEKTLFKNLSFRVARGQKYAVLGPNGIGKSTLLKIILQLIQPDSGYCQWNESVSIGYFSQNFRDMLIPEQTLLTWLLEQVPDTNEFEARKALAQMLFSKDTLDKTIEVLSGGECSRLVFAKLMLEKPNVLILDEPTNHLDMETIDGLIEGLQKFTGTVICVSHNRYFIERIATAILLLTKHKAHLYAGRYQDYHEQIEQKLFQAE